MTIIDTIPDAIAGSYHTPYLGTWKRDDGTPQDLTGATLTAKLKDTVANSTRASTGTFTIVSAPDGTFQWLCGSADVVASTYLVEFTATYTGVPDKTRQANWTVQPSL